MFTMESNSPDVSDQNFDVTMDVSTLDILRGRSTFIGGQERVVEALKLLPSTDFFLVSRGKIVSIEQIGREDPVSIHYRCLGGKGGFGSLLKSFRIHRSSNQLMMRNLEGRRVHDVKEEQRLKKWVERKAEREREKKRKREEKYQRLKNGGPKHQFVDNDYLRQRDMVLDQTEDSIEAGLQNIEKPEQTVEKSEEDSDSSEDEAFLKGFVSVASKKRKIAPSNEKEAKKTKLEKENQPGSSGFKMPKFLKKKEDKQEKNEEKIVEEVKDKVEEKKVEDEKPKEPENYDPVDLNAYESAEDLEKLGLGHLKHALEERGLKCGGTLPERAQRLFSVKGLDPQDYPKKIKALKK
ncbi:unnamed protein product [Bursaphelenchus xylophilus]|uniref:(pine wood nematode) hypothetical protein n=1 Tax=Bursaphelenchus xylophilus TaxID=6326 RepID=A0A1I7SBE8_BURXY|nr:unnamed protein product [Bursaphelenchus xylophilus]CAG9122047.1 unnamed protein product [Bursaphelenchus xylophilus]